MAKKVLIISTSLRGGSNSDILANECAKGAKEAGHDVELLSLKGKDIKYCIGCLSCQKTGMCVLKDDVADIMVKVKEAEVIVYATPIYYYEMCGQMKTLLDRLNPLYSTDYSFRDIYMIATAAENDETACVMRAKEYLEQEGYEVIIFHASGTGGKMMESLINSGIVDGVLDLTTTEWIDEIAGGIMAAGPERLDAAALNGIPQVVSVGAADMITFGERSSLPEKYKNRVVYMHNPAITVVKSNIEANIAFGIKVGEKLNQCKSNAALLLPIRGISMNDKAGSKYYGPKEDQALFITLKKVINNPLVEIIDVNAHINEEAFAISAAKKLIALMKMKKK